MENTAVRERATAAELRCRIAMVREWIVDAEDELEFQDAIRRIQDRWPVGRRQAIRYWVRARQELMDARERYQYHYYSPLQRGPSARYQTRPLRLDDHRHTRGLGS